MTTQNPTQTWLAQSALLQNAGITAPEVLEAIRRQTAPSRALWRIEATREALLAAFPGSDNVLVRFAALTLDLHGYGGKDNLGGSTRKSPRMPWAAQLGKGRWHAADGGSWRAAALTLLSEAFVGNTGAFDDSEHEVLALRSLFEQCPEAAPWVVSWALYRTQPIMVAGAKTVADLHRIEDLSALGSELDATIAASHLSEDEAQAHP